MALIKSVKTVTRRKSGGTDKEIRHEDEPEHHEEVQG